MPTAEGAFQTQPKQQQQQLQHQLQSEEEVGPELDATLDAIDEGVNVDSSLCGTLFWYLLRPLPTPPPEQYRKRVRLFE